jgi:hypothetical protein
MSASQIARVGILLRLVENVPGGIGRTALMKLSFFLQTLRRVPLGYSFSLYSYGPFDSDVLADLQTAEGLGVLSSEVHYYSGGYGYSIAKGPQAEAIAPMASAFVDSCADSINWVTNTFGSFTASDLELLGTTIFLAIKEPGLSDGAIALQVNRIKPHFSIAQINEKLNWLWGKGFLRDGVL